MEDNQAKAEEDLPTTLLPSHMYNRRLLGLTLAYPSLNLFSGSRFMIAISPESHGRVGRYQTCKLSLPLDPCQLQFCLMVIAY